MAKPGILMVDDDKDILAITKEFLTGKGYAVKTTSNPDVAVRQLRNGQFYAAVLDVRLVDDTDDNDFSGLDLAERIAAFSTIPILMLTGHKSFEAAKRALSTHLHGRALAIDIVLKKHGNGALLRALEKALLCKKVFLSYVKEDRPTVRDLYTKLQRAGFIPWMDIRDIPKGTRWEPAIERAIRATDFFVACSSDSSEDKRGNYCWEINLALELSSQKKQDDVFFVPLRLDKTEIKDPRIRRFQWIDYFEPDGFEQLIAALRHGGRKYLYSEG